MTLIIFAVLFILLLIGIYLIKKEWEVIGGVLIMVSSVLLVIALIIFPLKRFIINEEIEQYRAVKLTIDNSRGLINSDIERAALTTQIIEINKWLSALKYENETLLDIFVPDEVMELEYLK
ncbi:hypothetical protein [Brevibacillus laterosporus]|uniref:hypothetical protein n=1 Tax=Brevibacillus laterosporus TaxID=1465 RepID=UPI0011401C71|nr:hypothetical protein [Brevibacillus laterosporus]